MMARDAFAEHRLLWVDEARRAAIKL